MKVCIDPGHGMSNRQAGKYDPGATHTENGFEFQEATITLRYGLSLKHAFRANQVDAFMTRDDATDHTPVGSQPAMAKAAGCDGKSKGPGSHCAAPISDPGPVGIPSYDSVQREMANCGQQPPTLWGD